MYLAVVGAGGRFIGSNPSYSSFELQHLFKISEVRFILTDPELLQNVETASKAVDIPASNIFTFHTDFQRKAPDFDSWEVLLRHGESHWIEFDNEVKAKTTVAALMSTSGTTGLPKVAQSSHYSQVAQSIILKEENKPYEVFCSHCIFEL